MRVETNRLLNASKSVHRAGCALLSLIALFLLFRDVHPAWADGDEPTFPTPPRLATTAKELDEFRRSAGFEAESEKERKKGEGLLARPIEVPHLPGHWIFNYACPDDGATLIPIEPPARHQCPICKKVYTDDRTVAAWRCTCHYAAEQAVETLGQAFTCTGDERFAAEVKRILLQYADDYHTYPTRRDRWGRWGIFAPLGGRRYVQSLDEAVGVIRLAKGYDLTRESRSWSEAERSHVEKDFFRATADTLLWFNQDINNHQTWYNAGLMAIGSVLGDAELVKKVLNMKGGFRDQLKRSVTSDGLWYERTFAYHGYALQAMREIVDAGRRLGLPLHEETGLRAMVEAPLKFCYPNGQLPAINDSDTAYINMFDPDFEWAWKTWNDPLFARAYARGDATRLRQLPGAEKLEATGVMQLGSVNLSGAGLVAMREGSGDSATCAFLDYGPHGGGHGHPAKLNLLLFANGREWVLDPGRLDYSHKEHLSWYKQTVAHNTVTLGGKSQSPCTGQFLWMKSGEGWTACGVSSDKAYPDSLLQRYLLLTDKMLVDVFEVDSDKPCQTDWILHAISEKVTLLEPGSKGEKVSPGSVDGYQHLSDALRWFPAGASAWDFEARDGRKLRLHFLEGGAEQVFTSFGIGYSINEKVPCLLRRRETKKTRFVAVLDLTGDGKYVREVRRDGDGGVVVLTMGDKWSWFAPESKSVSIDRKGLPGK